MHLYLYLFTFVVFDIFDFENTATFKSGSGSLKVIETGTIQPIGYGFLLVFYRNFFPKTHRF